MVVEEQVDGRAGIDAALVERLVAAQFPRWAGLPVRPVRVEGWDNRTYRLGTDLTVRLPTAAGYAPAVEKEHRWLPVLAPVLPVPVPESVALGEPGEGYPFHWSVRRWLPGDTAGPGTVPDLVRFAGEVAGFLNALRAADATGGPAAGAHSFWRGAPPAHYDHEVRRDLPALAARPDRGFDPDRAGDVWRAALAATHTGPPVWFHGDIASGNLLVRDGRLAAVIDFGTSGVGDPACDLVIAYTMFHGPSREAFRAAVDQDPATWARARGWALWKSLLVLAGTIDGDPAQADVNRHVINEVLADDEP